MSRFSDIIDDIAAVYPTAGDTQFLVGDEYHATNTNWNRIVASHADQGDIRGPQQGAGAKGDNWRWTRYLPVTFSIWASGATQAENRLHALLCALYDVMGESDDSLSNVKERWYPKGVASGGRCVDVTCIFGIVVLASDVNVVESDAAVGAGFPVVQATSLQLIGELEDTSLPAIEITPES